METWYCTFRRSKVFELESFPFEVTQPEDMRIGVDELLLRFHFKEALPPGNTRRLTDLIEDWRWDVPDEYQPATIDDRFRFTKGRQVSTWLLIDTQGNDPSLSPFVNDLLRRVNDFAPLELVEISDSEHD
jgi:hypothetical protein